MQMVSVEAGNTGAKKTVSSADRPKMRKQWLKLETDFVAGIGNTTDHIQLTGKVFTLITCKNWQKLFPTSQSAVVVQVFLMTKSKQLIGKRKCQTAC